MNCDNPSDSGQLDSGQLDAELQAISAEILTLAHRYRDNTLALLALLRTLEQTHRDVQDNLFQTSLPDNRQEFYAILKDIEETGGWPYIERMRLRSFLSNLLERGSESLDARHDD